MKIAVLWFVLGFSPTLVLADQIDWETAIERVQASADEYRTYAVEVGQTSWVGAMYNGYKYDDHLCAIIGRMLGQYDGIRELETFDYPPIGPQTDTHELLVFSISLESWVAAARWAVDADEAQRINKWNLDCVGEKGIPSNLAMPSPSPNADFIIRDDVLLVYGDIESGFYDRFREILNENPELTEVALGSGGGSVYDALLAGSEIRYRGLDTTIYGNCFSACPFVFLGGVDRVIWVSPDRLGFHQVYSGSGQPVPIQDQVYIDIADYLFAMGADANTVIGWMLSAGPQEMYEPAPNLLCRPGVATFVQRICDKDGNF